MAEREAARGFLYNVLAALNDGGLVAAAGPSAEGDPESVAIAVDVLSAYLGLHVGDEEQKKRYALPPGKTLWELYSKAAREEPLKGFNTFLSLLEQRDFFAGAPPGSAEYERRLETARQHFTMAAKKAAAEKNMTEEEMMAKAEAEKAKGN